MTPSSSTSSARTRLGRSDLHVSELCLGGNVFGWTIDEAESHAVLDAFVAGGGTFVDTADVYSTWAHDGVGGQSERVIGSWLRARQDIAADIVIATKVGSPMPEGDGLGRRYVLDAVERSRERLGVERIDVLYAHRPDPSTPVAETMGVFHELVEGGTVRTTGLSNVTAAQLRAALDVCDRHGWHRPEVVQNEYNLIDRSSSESPLQQLCVEQQVATAPYYALAAGFLTGKYRADRPAPDSRRSASVLQRYGTPAGWALLDRIDSVARRHDATPAQVAIAWLLTRDGVTSPIASGTSPDHVAELLGATRIQLDAEDLALLDPDPASSASA